MGNHFNIICMRVVRAVRQVHRLLQTSIEGNGIVMVNLRFLEVVEAMMVMFFFYNERQKYSVVSTIFP